MYWLCLFLVVPTLAIAPLPGDAAPSESAILELEERLTRSSLTEFEVVRDSSQLPPRVQSLLARLSISGTLAEWGEHFLTGDFLSLDIPSVRHVISYVSPEIVISAYQSWRGTSVFLADLNAGFGCHYHFGWEMGSEFGFGTIRLTIDPRFSGSPDVACSIQEF